MSKSNSRYNGMSIETINAHAKTPFTKVATHNGRDYWDSEKRPGYYRAILITRDGIVKQGYWFSTNEEVQALIDRINERKTNRQNYRKEVMASDPQVKVGDVFLTNWGYDETHIDYVIVRSIKGRRAVVEDLTGTPGFRQVGEKRTKLIQGTAEYPYIKFDSFSTGHKTTLEEAEAYRRRDDVAYTGHYR